MGKLYDICVFLKYIKKFKFVCCNKNKLVSLWPLDYLIYIPTFLTPSPNYFEANPRHYVISSSSISVSLKGKVSLKTTITEN